MALPGIPIPETQCIGDSLFSINNALTALDSSVIELISAGASVTVQETPPSGASAGDLWFDSSSGVTSVYYDGTWVDVGGGDSGTSAGSVNGIVQCDGNGNFSAAPNLLTLINELSTNMQNIGNYPYLEYAWVTAPNAAGQTINADTITTLTLNTEVADTGNFGSVNGSNQITLAAGTYQFEANTHGSALGITGGAGTLALYNISDSLYVSRGSSQSGASDNCDNPILKGQFTIAAQKTFDLRYYNANLTTYIKNTTNNSTSTISTADAEQRTTLKLWKVG